MDEIKKPVRARIGSDCIIEDANGNCVVDVMSPSDRPAVIKAINGYGKAVEFIRAVDVKTEKCIADGGDSGGLIECLGDHAEQLLKHFGVPHD